MTDYLDSRQDYHDPHIAGIFDELSFWAARFGNLLFDQLALLPDLRILDVGCGNGFPLFELAQVHGRSCQVVGVDVWRAALDRAEGKRRIHGLDHVSIVEADGAYLPLVSGSFDLIVSNLGINNFEAPQAVLAGCARVAKADARLLLTTNLKGHMAEFYVVFRSVLTEYGDSAALERLAVNENHRGTKESACALVEGGGFRVNKVVEDQFHLRFVDGSALLRHALVRFGFLDGWRAAAGQGREREIFTILEGRPNSLARQQGELKMTIPMLYVEANLSGKTPP